jgi:hypothetical protein
MLLTYPDRILVENLCQGALGKYKISWSANPLATSYKIYRNRVPYGEAELIAETSDLEYIDTQFEIIDDTECYYRVSSVMLSGGESDESDIDSVMESELSRYQGAPNTTEYMEITAGTWTDSNNTRWDPHDNRYPNGESSYIGTNYLPLNVLRRYQFNKIVRDELWLLQDRGEPVYLIKKKRVNYDVHTEDDDRRVGRKNIVQYYEPLIIWASIASPGQTHIVSVRGAALEKNTRCWTIYTPRLVDGDIIITKDNKRWEIQNVTYQRSWRGSVTWQAWDIKALAVTDPVYQHPQLKNVDGSVLYQKKHFWQ